MGEAIHHSMTQSNKAFQIIGDSAGCVVVRLNPSTVTVRETFRDVKGFLCLVGTPLDFLHSVADQTRLLIESRETAMGNVPVFEMAWFGD